MESGSSGRWEDPWAAPPGGSPSTPRSSYGVPGQAPPPTEPPPPLRLAVGLMYVGAAFSVIGTVIGVADMDEVKRRIAEDNPSLSATEVESTASGAAVVAVLMALLTAGLWIWMAIMNRKGKSWARVVATVLGAIAGFFTLLSLAVGLSVNVDGERPVDTVISVLSLVLAVVILILLYRPESSAYYEAVSRPSSGYGYGHPPPGGSPPGGYPPY